MIFIHKTPVVERHPTTGERDLLRPRSTPTVNSLFLHEQLANLHTEEASNIASYEDIMENNNMLVMFSLDIPTMFFFFFLFLAQNLKITYEAT